MHQFLWKTSIFCSLVVVSLICSRSTRVGQAQTQAERPFSKWLRVEGDSVAIVVLVDVFMPDGSPAKNLIVSQWPKDQVAIDIASNQLTIVDPGTLGTTIRVKTRDQRFQATIPFLKHEVRDLAINGLKVKLVAIEFSDVAISVVDGDQPVPNAHVRALSDEEVVEGVTDTSGRVILKLPNGPVPSHVMAWTDNHRIGATKRQQPPALKAAAPSSISISIVPCRTHNIKIVDDNMQPVSGFKVMAFVTLPESERQVSLTDFGDLITDNNGIATTEWCPQWPGARIILRNDDPNRTRFPSGKGEFAFFQTHETLTESDITNIQVTHSKPRQLVRGNVKLPPNVPGGFLVKLLSFQGETENTSDLVYARVDADGDFVISVRPDCTYCAFLDDVRWISNTTDGIAFDSKTGTSHPPSLAVVEGTLVEIHVTQGKTGKPISNCGVWLQYNHMFEYERNGVEAAGMGGRGWWTETDQNGIARTWTAPGELLVHAATDGWSSQGTISKIIDGQPNRIDFHRAVAAAMIVSGRLKLSDGVNADLKNAEVVVRSVDGENLDVVRTTADANGHFTAEILSSQVTIIAKTANKESTGAIVHDDTAAEILIRLLPTTSYRGQLVDAENRPIADHELQLIGQLPNTLFGVSDDDPSFYYIETYTVKSNDEGNFEFNSIAQSLYYTLRDLSFENGESKTGLYLGERFFEPGEKGSFDVINLSEYTNQPVPRKKTPGD